MNLKIAAVVVGMILLVPTIVSAGSRTATIDVSVTIAPIFEISVQGPDNGHIAFGRINKDPNSNLEIQSGDVIINARSNLGQRYHITHALTGPLANEVGHQFGDEDMTVYARTDHDLGAAMSGVNVSTTPKTLFTSNPSGKSETLKANYKLNIRPTQPAGDYQSKLIYSIVAS